MTACATVAGAETEKAGDNKIEISGHRCVGIDADVLRAEKLRARLVYGDVVVGHSSRVHGPRIYYPGVTSDKHPCSIGVARIAGRQQIGGVIRHGSILHYGEVTSEERLIPGALIIDALDNLFLGVDDRTSPAQISAFVLR